MQASHPPAASPHGFLATDFARLGESLRKHAVRADAAEAPLDGHLMVLTH